MASYLLFLNGICRIRTAICVNRSCVKQNSIDRTISKALVEGMDGDLMVAFWLFGGMRKAPGS